MKGRWIELLEGTDRLLSSTRYMTLGGWHVASIIVLWQAYHGTLAGEFYGGYLLYSCGMYGLNSWNSKSVKIKEIEATTTPTQAPVVINNADSVTANVDANSNKLTPS